MKHEGLKKRILAGIFLSIGLILPFATAQIKEIGDSLLPMHIPVLLCGLICGAQNGFLIGLILPVLRSFLFSMPPLYPNSLWMAAELATYGVVIGLLYHRSRKKTIGHLYACLLVSMVSGRVVWGIAKMFLLGLSGKAFSFEAFFVGGVLDAIPGILLQLVLIPSVMKLISMYHNTSEKEEASKSAVTETE